MAYPTNSMPVYAKGTMDVWFFNPSTFDLDFYSNKVQTNSLTTSVTMGEINGSLRNPVLINLPDSAKLELEITAATSTLESRALSVGGELTYNGIVTVLETITATGADLVVSQTPVEPYGTTTVYGFVDKSGMAYEIDPETKKVKNFTATAGETYCVRYFVRAASAHQLTIFSDFDPSIEIVMIRMPLFSTQNESSTKGTKVADRYIWIPRMQFGGKAPLKGDQTTADSDDLSGPALPYEASYALAYMVDIPVAGATALIKELAIVGGDMTLAVGETKQIPVKYVMPDDSLVQPTYTDLTYASATTAKATVTNAGAVTGVATGSSVVTVTLADPALTAKLTVNVVAGS